MTFQESAAARFVLKFTLFLPDHDMAKSRSARLMGILTLAFLAMTPGSLDLPHSSRDLSRFVPNHDA